MAVIVASSTERGIQIQVVGNWMSKIEGLLRRIVRLRQVAPEEKSLVFSQYPDALKLVGKALNVNNIKWLELRGGAKVSRCFPVATLNGPPNVTVRWLDVC